MVPHITVLCPEGLCPLCLNTASVSSVLIENGEEFTAFHCEKHGKFGLSHKLIAQIRALGEGVDTSGRNRLEEFENKLAVARLKDAGYSFRIRFFCSLD